VLALSAAKQGQDAAVLAETRQRGDEALRRGLEEKEKAHQRELAAAEGVGAEELGKLGAQMDKMRKRHDSLLAGKEKELADEHHRLVTTLKDRHSREVGSARTHSESLLNSAVSDLTGKGKVDSHRLQQERKEDQLRHELALSQVGGEVL
jgi:hypothetical protein